ncbi:hypothetical protein LCGC14_2243250, partial [marine sediment metagenome]
VRGIHHLHMRSLAHKRVIFSAHVWVDDQPISEAVEIRKEITRRLSEMGIKHVTLQFESGDFEHKGIFCDTCSTDDKVHGHEDDECYTC